MIDNPDYAARRERLRPLMHKSGVDALLVTMDANRYYLSGFEPHDPQFDESSGCLIIMADGKDILCTDARFTNAAARLWDEERIFIYYGHPMDRINEFLKDKAPGAIGFDGRHVSYADFARVSDGLSFTRADGLVEELRRIKDPLEIARMERACVLNHKLMQWVPGVLVPGRTEAQLAWDIEQFFRNHGAQGLSFSSIVAVGPNAALPHAEPGGAAIADGCAVLVDVGCRLDDYCSDQTRTFWAGNSPHPHFTENLKLVKEAQARAIKAIRPGAGAAEVYAMARGYLDSRGVGQWFTHGLGHGIGLQTHEAPSLNPRSTVVLEPGMIVTVEPGLYYPGKGGVRWEHMVLVTEDGCRVL